MSDNTKIQWADSTWNPVTGCTEISPGCENCYARKQAERNQLMGSPNYRNGFKLTMHPHTLDIPLRWKRPRRIFVCSMGDLFHADVDNLFLNRVFGVMRKAHWHTFMVLTKRSRRLESYARQGCEWPGLGWPANVWVGVSLENRDQLNRLYALKAVPAPAIRFLSCEPLLGSLLPIDLAGIHQVIVGGESAWDNRRRDMDLTWARELRDECARQGVAYFFKQTGGRPNDKGGDLDKIPEDLRIRQWPELSEVHR